MQQLRRHAEVLAALQHPGLVPRGSAGPDDSAHAAVRAAVHHALPPARLAAWRQSLVEQVLERLQAIPAHRPVDLVAEVAEPCALALAVQVTGLPADEAPACARLAQQLFLAAARSEDGRPSADTAQDAVALAQRLAASPAARAPGIADVQTFVALSQSLPALWAGAWQRLLDHPAPLAMLLAEPRHVPRITDELLRLGSPAQAVFREAREELQIGRLRLARGEPLALMLAAANRDAARFVDPERFDPDRDARAALGLGAGPHRCAGGALVRMALEAATGALLGACSTLAWADPAGVAPPWRGGFALRAPAALPVRLDRRAHVTKGT